MAIQHLLHSLTVCFQFSHVWVSPMKIAVTAVVHSGLHRTGKAFRGTEGELVEFVYSDGFGMGNSIAGVWPSGIYGLHHDPPECKYYQLVRNMTAGRTIECQG